jgi:hypothetical protein
MKDKSFNISFLKGVLDLCPFQQNELAYLSLTSISERTIRDKLAYYLFQLYQDDKDMLFSRELAINFERPIKKYEEYKRNLKKQNESKRKRKKEFHIAKRTKSLIDLGIIQYEQFAYNHKAIIEFTAAYTSKIMEDKEIAGLVSKVKEDFEKNIPFMNKCYLNSVFPYQYAVLLITDFSIDSRFYDKIEDSYMRYDGYIKYLFDKNLGVSGGLHKMMPTYQKARSNFIKNCQSRLEYYFPSSHYQFEGGILAKNSEQKAYDFEVKVYYFIIEKLWCRCTNRTKRLEQHICCKCNLPILEHIYSDLLFNESN